MLAVSLDAPLGWLDDIYKNNSGNENNKLYRLYRNRTKIMKNSIAWQLPKYNDGPDLAKRN